jgi:hypothetical protein
MMVDFAKQYPDVVPFLDKTDDYVNKASEFVLNDDRFLVVTQQSEIDGGQLLFKATLDGWVPIDSDTNIDVLNNSQIVTSIIRSGVCGASSSDDHMKVGEAVQDQVDKFSSANGPDGGNLACVWAVRHIVKKAINRFITRTDGTAVLDAELQKCFGGTLEENEVDAGSIVISPTVTRPDGSRNIGHVGLLGPGGVGLSRLIFSNSSSAAMWKQNFTLDTWIKRYRVTKGLKVRFYPLPLRPPVTS